MEGYSSPMSSDDEPADFLPSESDEQESTKSPTDTGRGHNSDFMFTTPKSKSKQSVAPSVQTTGTDPYVKSALQEITSILNAVVQRVERVETELKKGAITPSSSSDSTPSRQKIRIPLVVRVSLNIIYFHYFTVF